MRYTPFHMERWQSTWEHHVRFNLSESGVHPLAVDELLEVVRSEGEGAEEEPLGGTRLEYGQSNGSELLRDRIAALHPGATRDNVLVTAGGAEANFVSHWFLLEPGAPVAAVVPNYMQVPGLAKSFGDGVLTVPLREEEGWQPDPGEVRRAFEEGASALLVTNPNNPTGAVLSEDRMDAIVDAARQHGAWILADEVYRGAELDGRESPTFMGRYERVLATGSLSKAYGLPGLRLGWVVGPSDAIEDLWGRTDYTTIAPATLSDSLARQALAPGPRRRLLERTRGILRANLPVVEEWAARQGEAFHLHRPRAGAIAYLRYRLPLSSDELVERLRADHEVLLVPGSHFEMEGYVRIGYGIPAEELRQALERVEELVTGLTSSGRSG